MTRTELLRLAENAGAAVGIPQSRVLYTLMAGQEVEPGQYFPVAPQFTLTSHDYQWLRHAIFVGFGAKQTDSVKIAAFSVM
jgi:hypothetical protein